MLYREVTFMQRKKGIRVPFLKEQRWRLLDEQNRESAEIVVTIR
jgi:hypothetical protein